MIILTFFLPFFVVSCGDQEIAFSGFETAFGKKSGNFIVQDGTPLTLILILTPAVLLVLTFFTRKIKEKIKQSFFFKNIFVIAPVFNIVAAVTLRVAAGIMLEKEIASLHRGLAGFVTIRAGYGFIIYIILNAALLVLAGVNYFIDFKKE